MINSELARKETQITAKIINVKTPGILLTWANQLLTLPVDT